MECNYLLRQESNAVGIKGTSTDLKHFPGLMKMNEGRRKCSLVQQKRWSQSFIKKLYKEILTTTME